MLMKRIVAVAFAGPPALAVMAPVALAEERVCQGTIGPTTTGSGIALEILDSPQDAPEGILWKAVHVLADSPGEDDFKHAL